MTHETYRRYREIDRNRENTIKQEIEHIQYSLEFKRLTID